MEETPSQPTLRYESIPKSDSTDTSLLTYASNNVVKCDPENKIATEVLDKDIKRWRRKLEELERIKVPWSTIFFGLGSFGLSTVFPYINISTQLVSIPACVLLLSLFLMLIAVMLWKIQECNIPKIAKEILMDLPKTNERGEKNGS